jgi:hypothetical protein
LCFPIFQIDRYTWIPINNDSHKYDMYRAERVSSDNDLWFAVKVDGTITEDIHDIMHTFIDIYTITTTLPHSDPEILLESTFEAYDMSSIDTSVSYYLYLDVSQKRYFFDISYPFKPDCPVFATKWW